MLTHALYYPWMHFQDDNWVKLALLTWDSVTRVRARDVDNRDSDLVRQVKNETKLLNEISPSEQDLRDVADNFGEVLESLGDQLVERYRPDLTSPQMDFEHYIMPESNAPRRWISPVSQAPPFAWSNQLTWIYCGDEGTKIGRLLRAQLVGRGLGVPQESWLGLNPKLASIYLATLTDAIARHNRISPATDDTRMHDAVGALDRLTELLLDDRPARPRPDPENAFVHLALQAVIKPDRLAHVPVTKLIKFRDRHSAELTAFRDHVAGLADELQQIATVENVDIAHAHLESLYRNKTKPQLDNLRRSLRSHGVESTAGTLGLKVDLGAASGTIIGSIAAAGGQLAVAGTAVALTVVPYLAGRLKARRQTITSSPVAYLLAADRKLPG